VITLTWLLLDFFGHGLSWGETAHGFTHVFSLLGSPGLLSQFLILPIFFLVNFGIIFGPMLAMGVSQIRGFQPGDAEWGVKLEHVRGQAEAKEEIRRIVSLWQSGERPSGRGGTRSRAPTSWSSQASSSRATSCSRRGPGANGSSRAARRTARRPEARGS
jgi:hypothetical protein